MYLGPLEDYELLKIRKCCSSIPLVGAFYIVGFQKLLEEPVNQKLPEVKDLIFLLQCSVPNLYHNT